MSGASSKAASSPAPTEEQQQQQQQQRQASLNAAYTSFKHNASLLFLIGAPVLIALPPRKIDLYTFSLTGAFVASANQLTKEKTGRGLISEFGHRFAPQATTAETKIVQSNLGVRERVDNAGVTHGGSLLQTRVRKDLDWKEERLREEQEKLNEGEGYGGMIVDQIWDVWNQKGRQNAEKAGRPNPDATTSAADVPDVVKEQRRKIEFPEIGK